MIRKKTSIIWSIPDDDFLRIVEEEHSYSDILRRIGMNVQTGSHKTLKKRMQDIGINLEEFKLKSNFHKSNKLLKIFKEKRPVEEYLVENRKVNSVSLKKRLIREGYLDEICYKCGIGPEWNGEKLVLQLDHINGIHNDNRLENLRILCPNCHSQTKTFGTKQRRKKYFCKECGNEISKHGKLNLCVECASKSQRRIERPSREELQELIDNNSWEGLGRMFGVSGNTIKKWAKKYGLKTKKVSRLFKVACPECKKEFHQKNIGQKYCSIICKDKGNRKIARPSKQELFDLLDHQSIASISRKFGWASSTIRGWIEYYEKYDD